MSRAWRNSGGFSLVEVLAALFILGVAAVTVLGVFSTNLRSIHKSDRHALATIHARSLLDEALSVGDVEDARGEFDLGEGFWGTREVEIVSDKHGVMMYAVDVLIEWPPSGRVKLSGTRVLVELDE